MTGTMVLMLAVPWVIGGILVIITEYPPVWNALLIATKSMRRPVFHPPLPDSLRFRPMVATPRDISLVLGAATVVGGAAGWLLSTYGWMWQSIALMTITTIAGGMLGGGGVIMRLRSRYQQAIDQMLPSACEQILTLMESGQPFPIAVQTVCQRFPDQHPLRHEWEWLLAHLGTRRSDGRHYMTHEICAILAAQTLTSRHTAVLLRLGEALQRPHDAQVAVVRAIVETMDRADQRRQLIRGELAQMRASGVVITGIILFINGFLAYAMGDRFVKAYSNPIGIVVAIICGLFAMAPVMAGALLGTEHEIAY